MIDEETPDVYITLVHGTWGRGFFPDRRFFKGAKRKSFWFDDGSLFTTRLKSKLKELGISYKIHAHEWSGANSILERAKVAKQLAAQLQASRAEYPAAKQVVIAHSHGGNVVRLALREVPDRRHILVVTMATPFAEINTTSSLNSADLNVILTGCCYWSTFLYMLLALKIFFILSMALSFGAVLIVRFLFFRLVANSTRTEKLVNATRGGMNWRQTDVPTVVIRAVDDEASLSLAVAAIGNRISLAL